MSAAIGLAWDWSWRRGSSSWRTAPEITDAISGAVGSWLGFGLEKHAAKILRHSTQGWGDVRYVLGCRSRGLASGTASRLSGQHDWRHDRDRLCGAVVCCSQADAGRRTAGY